MTTTPPEQTPPAQPQPPAPTAPATPVETGKLPPWGDRPENFDADKAWELIQKARGETDAKLRSEVQSLRESQQQRDAALAAALGIKPEETSDTDNLAQQVTDLQNQFAKTQLQATVLTVAQNNGIPPEFQHWLTATDAAALDAQAKALVPMVQATLAAQGQTPPPVFAANPGQGQATQPPSQTGAVINGKALWESRHPNRKTT